MTTLSMLASASMNRSLFYEVNSDTVNARVMADSGQELVQFRSGSSMRIWYNDQLDDYAPHWHTALEIIVPIENWYDAKVGGTCFHLVPGDILLIPAGELHALKAPSSGSRFIFLFDLTAFTGLHDFAGIQPIIASPIHLTRAAFPQIYDDVYQLLIQMKNEYFTGNEFAELTIHALLLHLFVKLGTNHLESINLFPNMRVHKQKEYMDKFNTVMDYIDSHYTEDLNQDDIAASVGFSKYHFSRLFKQYTNYTFSSYITRRRIRAAENLLEQPELSVTEVALQSGFPSISTFNRVFKQVKNCTPSEYREKNSYIRNAACS